MDQARVTDSVGKVLKRKGTTVWCVSPEASVFDAIQMMTEKNIGACLVVSDRKLAGIISERDCARNLLASEQSCRVTRVREIMSRHVTTISPDCTVDECMRIVTDNRVRHLPVMEGGNIVGLISIGDLVNWVISAHQETIFHLESYILGRYPG
jgi:CBS domain-containing protein